MQHFGIRALLSLNIHKLIKLNTAQRYETLLRLNLKPRSANQDITAIRRIDIVNFLKNEHRKHKTLVV